MAYENLNISNLFLYNVLMNKFLLRKDDKTICKRVFEAICQDQSVNIKYTERIYRQILTKVRSFRDKIRKRCKGSNAKRHFLKSIATSTWPFKVCVSEFDAHDLNKQVTTLKNKCQALQSEVEKKSRKYRKTKEKLDKERAKLRKEREFQRKVYSARTTVCS